MCIRDSISANRMPNIVFDVVAGGALSSVVIPVLARPLAAHDDDATRRTVSALLTWTLLILVPLSILGMLASRPVMSVLLSGVADPGRRLQMHDVGARMLVIFMPQIALYGVGVVLTGVLQAHRRFLAPAIAPLLSSIVVITAYLAYAAQAGGDRAISSLSRAEELTLSLGTTLAVAALTLPLLLPGSRLGLRLRPTLRMPGEGGRQIRRLAVAGAVGLGAQQLATLVVIVVANRVEGALVLHELAWTIFLVPWAVLAVPIATSVFPDLTRSAAVGDNAAYAASVSAALRAIVVSMLAAAAVLAAVAQPAAELLVALTARASRGAGTADLARAISTFAPGLVGYGALALLTRAAYARNEGRAAAAATAAGFATAAVLDVALAGVVPRHWLVAALGIGNTVGMSVAAVLLLRWLHRAIGATVLRPAGRVTARAAAAAVAAAICGRVASDVASPADAPAALAATALGAVAAVAAFAGVASVVLRAESAAVLRMASRRSRT